nr:beta-galactoside alpha-2,6-sialyltransferase 1-like [Penaeus vannamei]
MRLVGLSLWIFLNLILLGTGTYLYLLWVQYWRYAENNRFQPVSRNYTGHFADRRHGVVLMLAHCETVDAVEFVPSLRVTRQCHYWDATTDQGCTFGGWHPLASEKLLALALSVASDEDAFSTGFVRIPGFRSLSCPSQDPAR